MRRRERGGEKRGEESGGEKRGGAYIFFLGWAQHPLGPENPLGSDRFPDPRGGVVPPPPCVLLYFLKISIIDLINF